MSDLRGEISGLARAHAGMATWLASLSIGQRLLALVLAVALPLNLVIFVVIQNLTEAARTSQHDGLQFTARAMAASINAELEKYATLIEVLGRSPALLEPELDAFEVEARRQLSLVTDAWVIVADQDGRQLLGTSLGAQPSPRPFWPPRTMEAQQQAMASRSLTLSDIIVESGGGKAVAMLEVAVPKDGRPFRVLALAIDARHFQRAIAAQPMPESWLAGIIDGEGRYVARVPGGEALVGELASTGWRATRSTDGWAEFNSREGDPVINYNTQLKYGDWAAAIGVKKAALDTLARGTTQWAILFGGLLSLLSLALATVLGRNIALPIASLQADVSHLGGPPSAIPSGPPEIAALRSAMTAARADRERNEQRSRMLIALTSRLIEAHERDELGRIAFESVAPLLDADICLKYRLDAGRQQLQLAYSHGLSADDIDTARTLEIDQAFCGTVATRLQPLTADAQRIAVDPKAGFLRSLGVRAYSCHPLRSRDGQALGTFAIASRIRGAFTADETELLATTANVLSQAVERMVAEQTVKDSHDTFRRLIDRSPFGIYIVDADFRLARVSDGAQKVFATVHPLIGRDFAQILRQLWPEPFASEAIGHFRHTLATGMPYGALRTVEERHDIGAVEAYDWKIERIAMPGGRPGVVCHFYDLSERINQETALQVANERQTVLMRELAHRGKNLLAVVQAIARRSLTGQRSSGDDRDAFLGRLQALAQTFAGFTETEAVASPLHDIVRGALRSFVDRIDIQGPAILVDAKAAQTFALILHELATNATKYGALSVPSGKLKVSWSIGAHPETFAFVWEETGGPSFSPAQSTGFGTVLVTQIAGAEFDCTPTIEAITTGLIYQFETKLSAVGHVQNAHAQAVRPTPSVRGDPSDLKPAQISGGSEPQTPGNRE